MSRAGSSSGAMYTSRILILFECRQSYYCTEECTHKKPFSANLLLDYRSSSLIDKTIYQSWKIHWVARRLWLHSSLVCLILIKRHGNTTGGRTRRFRVKICVTENPSMYSTRYANRTHFVPKVILKKYPINLLG